MLVQRHMRAHNGTCLQLRCDEKGFLAVCAFGLPGQTHEDGPARALLAALSIIHALQVKSESVRIYQIHRWRRFGAVLFRFHGCNFTWRFMGAFLLLPPR